MAILNNVFGKGAGNAQTTPRVNEFLKLTSKLRSMPVSDVINEFKQRATAFSPAELLLIVKSSESSTVASEALKMLKGHARELEDLATIPESTLRHIAYNSRNGDAYCNRVDTAIAMLDEVVSELKKPEALVLVAIRSKDSGAREAAVKKLSELGDTASLRTVAYKSRSRDTVLMAATISGFDESDMINCGLKTRPPKPAPAPATPTAKKSVTGSHYPSSSSYDEKAGKIRRLTSTALESKDKKERLAAVSELEDTGALIKIATQTYDVDVGKAAVEKLERREDLARVYGNTRVWGISLAANEKIHEIDSHDAAYM